MFRIPLGFLPKTLDLFPGGTLSSAQIVRWRRKPRWLPVAKSKVFRVPERPKRDEDEYRELMRLHNNYRTQMRSIRTYFREEVALSKLKSTADNLVVTPEQEEEDLEKCQAENNAWNAAIAAERNKRLAEENRERKEYIQERLELAKIRKEEHMQKIEEIVRREKESSKSFITADNLDSAIEYALANPVDYNFCIDLKKNIYHGRNALIEQLTNKSLNENPNVKEVITTSDKTINS